MKKMMIVLVFLSTLMGCAFFQQQKANWEACKADPACSEQAKTWQGRGETAGQLVATGVATVVPGAALAIIPTQKVVGYIAFALAMLIGGHALTKKQAVVTPSVPVTPVAV